MHAHNSGPRSDEQDRHLQIIGPSAVPDGNSPGLRLVDEGGLGIRRVKIDSAHMDRTVAAEFF